MKCKVCGKNEAVPKAQHEGPTVTHLCDECYPEYVKLMKKPTCDACGKNVSIGVCCVPGVPCSAAYCRECLDADCHPWDILVANTVAIDGLQNAQDWWRDMVENTLKHTGRTLEEFNDAVSKALKFEQMDDEDEKPLLVFSGSLSEKNQRRILHIQIDGDREPTAEELNIISEFFVQCTTSKTLPSIREARVEAITQCRDCFVPSSVAYDRLEELLQEALAEADTKDVM